MNTLLNLADKLHDWLNSHRKLALWLFCPFEIMLMGTMVVLNLMMTQGITPSDINWAVKMIFAITGILVLAFVGILHAQWKWAKADPRRKSEPAPW
jgi:hypothetical protein